jgi:hypothetical protein
MAGHMRLPGFHVGPAQPLYADSELIRDENISSIFMRGSLNPSR